MSRDQICSVALAYDKINISLFEYWILKKFTIWGSVILIVLLSLKQVRVQVYLALVIVIDCQ